MIEILWDTKEQNGVSWFTFYVPPINTSFIILDKQEELLNLLH